MCKDGRYVSVNSEAFLKYMKSSHVEEQVGFLRMVERGREIKEKKLEGGRQIVVKSGNGVFFFLVVVE